MKLKQYTLIVFDEDSCSDEDYLKYYKKTFPLGKLFLYFGEVAQIPGHCIIGDLCTGNIMGMYHTENFRAATEDEI